MNFPNKYVKKILEEISGAIQYLHQYGIKHGDIKPSNIMYDR